MNFNQDIVNLARQNTYFRQVLVTGSYSQVVLMSIAVEEDIGAEVHKADQILVIVEGQAEVVLNNKHSRAYENYLIFVPAGTQHNIINKGNKPLKLFTIYAPSQHKPDTVHNTKADAEDEY